ncbi:histidine kinase, partial [candidate division KSB1 bacterium]|nr:histidine kinase [candidate division KSB1 bacterium]
MKLKTKFLLFFALIYITLISVTVSIYQNNKILFLACEILIALSLIFFFHFYKIFFKPFDLLQAGIDSIADKDFGLKFLPIGQPEFDGLIDVYNKMIDQLRLERIKASEKHFFLEKLIDASPAGIIILDINHNIKVINKVGMQILNINTNEYPTAIKALQDPWGAELSKLENNSTILIQMNGINRYKCHKSYFLDRGVKRTFYYIEDLAKEILQVESQAYEKVIRMMSHEVNNSVGS